MTTTPGGGSPGRRWSPRWSPLGCRPAFAYAARHADFHAPHCAHTRELGSAATRFGPRSRYTDSSRSSRSSRIGGEGSGPGGLPLPPLASLPAVPGLPPSRSTPFRYLRRRRWLLRRRPPAADCRSLALLALPTGLAELEAPGLAPRSGPHRRAGPR